METTSDTGQTVHHTTGPAIVLVPGHWLGAWPWEAVTADLQTRGYAVTPAIVPRSRPR